MTGQLDLRSAWAEQVLTTPLQWRVRLDGPTGGLARLKWAFAPAILTGGAGGYDVPILAKLPEDPDYLRLAERALDAADRYARAVRASRHLVRIALVSRPPRAPLTLLTPQLQSLSGTRVAADGALGLASDLVEALAEMHQHHLLHLDLHPGMVGLDGEGHARLIGFGVDVRDALPDGQSNALLGRRHYSPPELWDASARMPLGPWSDIFALSATLYQVLTGAAPPDFRERADDPAAARTTMLTELSQAMGDTGRTARSRIIDLILWGLSPRIADRPAGLDEWLSAVRALPKPVSSGPKPDDAAPVVPNAAKQGSTVRSIGLALLIMAMIVGVAGAIAWANLYSELFLRKPAPMPSPTSSATLSLNDDVFPTPSPTPSASPNPDETVDIDTVAQVEVQDDPVRLNRILAEHGATSVTLTDARRYFRPYGDGEDGCSQPLLIHLRLDGEGLVIVRPAGLAWVTQWVTDGARADHVDLRIQRVVGESGEVDVPGLVGSERRLSFATDALDVAYLDDGHVSENNIERYSVC